MSRRPLMTVSGIRGIVGETLSEEFCARVAFVQSRLARAATVVVGRDTRPSGTMLASAITRGIHAAGARVVDIGISPTPTTCVATAHLHADAGIIITASHNPLPYNGYKMVHRSGRLGNDAECAAVYHELDTMAAPSWKDMQLHSPEPDERFDAGPVHVEGILRNIDVERVRGARMRIAVDSINGAAGAVFPSLLEKLGVAWVGVHNGLDGAFVHNPEPRPEHLTDLAALLRATPDAWGGFAFDPDGDRLATMGERGEPLSEEMTLALALDALLSRHASDVATNLSTSMLIDDVARAHGVKVVRTRIGEANVVAGMLANGCLAGGEGNGGVIFPAVSTVRDGLTALALLLEAMARAGTKLTRLAAAWPSYCMVKEKLELGAERPHVVLERLAARCAGEALDQQDGLKLTRPDGWVHLRPSNTEPILRCIAEARTEPQARALIRLFLDRMKQAS
jgi:phosphomannomutase